MDMLRFHKFTIGWAWVADYGSSRRRRRVHGAATRIRRCTTSSRAAKYPATLSPPPITTTASSRRTRFKYAATLQARASRDTPLLIRIETNAGHGASGLEKQLETAADIYSFIMFNMGVTPSQKGTQ